MPLAAALQTSHLPVVIVNPRRVRDFAPPQGVIKTDSIDIGYSLYSVADKTWLRLLPDQAREMGSLLSRRQLIEMLTSEPGGLQAATAVGKWNSSGG
jgi:transposase